MINTWNPAEISDKLNQLECKIQANDVIANPTGEATETLTKIGIDGDIYSFAAEDVSYDNTDSGLTADDVQGAIDEIAPALSKFVTGSLVNIDYVVFSNDENTITISAYTGTNDQNGYYIMFGKANKQLRVYSVTDGTPTLLWSIQGT